MPTPVPARAVSSELAAHLVRAPVGTSVGGIWASQLAFLLGRALEQAAMVTTALCSSTASARTVRLQWRPSLGCRLALLRVDVGPDAETALTGGVYTPNGNRIVLSLTLPTGATREGPDFDGSTVLYQRATNLAARQRYECLIDLGTVGTVSDAIHAIGVTITGSGGDTHQGFEALSLVELPVASLRPESSEEGIAGNWPSPRNELHDGDGGQGQGFPTILLAEQSARTSVRLHWQVGTYEDTGEAWFTTSATHAALDWKGGLGTTYDPVWRVRAKSTYGTSAGCVCTMSVHYQSTDAGELRIAHTPVGGSLTRTTLTLPSTAGAWGSTSVAVTLPATGTSQEVDLSFDAKIASGTLYLSSIALIGNEAT